MEEQELSTLQNHLKEQIDPALLSADINTVISDVFKCLNSLGVCASCCFRFIHMYNMKFFEKSKEELEKTFLGLIQGGKLEKEPFLQEKCIACLGIAQDLMNEGSKTFKEGVIEQLKHCGFDLKNGFNDYNFAINIPSSVEIRNISIWIYLREKFSYFKENPMYLDLKDVLRWILTARFRAYFNLMYFRESELSISISFKHEGSAKEYEFIYDILKKPKRKTDSSIGSVHKSLVQIKAEDFKRVGTCPPNAVVGDTEVSISVTHAPIFIAGRYCKYARSVSQSKWVVDGLRVAPHSVEELIADPIIGVYEAQSYKFHGAGREDADVRMLGRGRPFILEIANPHKMKVNRSMESFQQAINSQTDLIQVRDLQLISKSLTAKIKEGETDKSKTYRCLVWVSKPIVPDDLLVLNNIKDLVLEQRTPIRVLHRRSLASRKKIIHKMSYKYINQHFLILDLDTSAGTYVKEFIHGDLGRTTPNFNTILGCEADILQLDVLEITMDFPPSTSGNKTTI